MLNFIKKLFAKEEAREEKIGLDELDNWLNEKAKPLFDNLNNEINETVEKINNEKEKALENIRILVDAKLQNPKIPERVKTIMEGNRAAFIKKVSFFLGNIDLKFSDYNEILKKCDKIKDEIDLLGKSTARSYQVLNEFFAREAEKAASNIKNIENYSKGIELAVKNSKIPVINKIKNGIINIQQKIKIKNELENSLKNKKNELENNKSKKLEIESKISEIKSSIDYKIYEKLLEEKKDIEVKINDIENKLFHDFSVLERALKKYSKIAFENEKLILNYLESPIRALTADNDLVIIKILNDLKNNIINNKLELDAKKSGKMLSKIKELSIDYFLNLQKNYNNLKNKINELGISTENNKSNIELKLKNKELEIAKLNIENLNNNILNISSELEKINIEKLKEDLQEEVSNIINTKIVLI